MKKKITVFTLVVVHFVLSLGQSGLDEALESYVGEGKLAGLSALICQKGEIIYQTHKGVMDLESQEKMRPQTLFRLASMTKPLTSVAILQLLEKKKLNLYDPLKKFIPEFKNLMVYGENGEKIPLVRDITVKHLLMHTTGIASGSFGKTPVDQMIRDHDFSHVKTLEEYVLEFTKFPLIHQPGEGFTYSVNTDILARIVEIVAKESFDQYLKQNVLKPLKMNDTYFQVPEEKVNLMASVYTMTKNGLKRVAGPGERMASFPRGNTGLISTMDDYHRFARMLLNKGELEGERILKKKTVALMTENHIPESFFPIDPMDIPMTNTGFGLGVAVVERPDGEWKKMPLGIQNTGNMPDKSFFWMGAYHTFFWIDPDREIIGIVMSQSPDVGKLALFQEFLEGFYGGLESVR